MGGERCLAPITEAGPVALGPGRDIAATGEDPDDSDKRKDEAAELAMVSRRLRRLIGMRQILPLNPFDQAEFERLSRREGALLHPARRG